MKSLFSLGQSDKNSLLQWLADFIAFNFPPWKAAHSWNLGCYFLKCTWHFGSLLISGITFAFYIQIVKIKSTSRPVTFWVVTQRVILCDRIKHGEVKKSPVQPQERVKNWELYSSSFYSSCFFFFSTRTEGRWFALNQRWNRNKALVDKNKNLC